MSIRSHPKISSTVGIAALFLTFTAGCATPRWAQDDEWKKKTGWVNDQSADAGFWGLFRALDGVSFEP